MSMKSSSSANSTISSYFAASCSRVRPGGEPAEHDVLAAGQLAVEADAEREQRADAAVDLDAARRSAAGCPATVRISVDLPAPLAPTTPSTVPCATSKETSLSASISRTIALAPAEPQHRALAASARARATSGR